IRDTSLLILPPVLGNIGECKPIIKDYLLCLRRARGTNEEECRGLAKMYLKCRMENNLMAPDEMRNLGLGPGADAEAGFNEEEGEAKEDIAETVAGKIEEKKKEMKREE
ncbi:MAG: hypothetical protein L6R35_006775, partial [Caloplaca aegaea]